MCNRLLNNLIKILLWRRILLQGCVGADVGVDALTEAGVAVVEGVTVVGAVVAVGDVLGDLVLYGCGGGE